MKIPTVVFGLGRIGLLYGLEQKRIQPASHIEAISKNPNFELIGVCDPSKQYRQKLSKNYKKPKIIHSSHEELLEFLKKENILPQLFVIATPAETHYKIINDILKTFRNSNKKSLIFCEKPLTNNLSTSKKIKKILTNSNFQLVVNHTRRWSVMWNLCNSNIQNIGDIQHANFVFSTSPENKVYDQMRDGVHIADLINWYNIKKQISVKRVKLPYLVYDFYMWGNKGKIEVLNNGQIFKLYKKSHSSRYSGFFELKLEKKSNEKDFPLKNAYSEFSDYFKKNKPLTTNLSDAIESIKTFKSHVYKKSSR